MEFVLVPKEPTAEMIEAAWKSTSNRSPAEYMAMELSGDPRKRHAIKMKQRYAAMIAAAPQPK